MIENLSEFGREQHDYFVIDIRPTTKCNYDCYYCKDLHNNTNPITKLNTNNIKSLMTAARRAHKKNIHVYIYGGEPTLYSNLIDFVNEIGEACEKNDLIEIQSNLSRGMDWFKQFGKKLTCRWNVKISASYHSQQASMGSFIKTCMFLKKKRFLNVVTYMYNRRTKEPIKEFKRLQLIIGKEYCEISPLISSTLDQNPKRNNNTCTEIDHIFENEDVSLFAEHSFMFNKTIPYILDDGTELHTARAYMWKSRENNFKGYSCTVNFNKIYIDWNGECYQCINNLLTSTGSVFNINDMKTFDRYFKNMSCINCVFDKCFFDLEYKKSKVVK